MNTETTTQKHNHSIPLRRLLAAAVILILPVAGATALEAVIADTSGKVEVRLANSSSWRPAEVGQVVPIGATISTSFRASAELTIGESTLEVEALTRMTIDELIEEAQTDRTDLNLQVGRIRADVRSAENRDTEFRVSSPIAVAAVRGTSVSFDGANLEVSEGIVALSNRYNETVSVGGGESSTTTGDSPPQTPVEESESGSSVEVSTDDDGDDDGDDEQSGSGGSSSSSSSLTVNWEFPEVTPQ